MLDSVTDKLTELGLPSFHPLFNERLHRLSFNLLTSGGWRLGASRHFVRSCTFSS